MKANIKTYSLIMALIMIMNFSAFSFMEAYAHDTLLEVTYDKCIYSYGDGIDEMWYVINDKEVCYHLSDDENTLTYTPIM